MVTGNCGARINASAAWTSAGVRAVTGAEIWVFLAKERADTFSDILCLKGLIAQRQRLLDGIGFIRIEGEIQNYVTVSICLKDIVRL